MKKSQLRKIIRESIKGLLNEQITCPPGEKRLRMTPCPGSTFPNGSPMGSGVWYTGGCATIDGQEPNPSHVGTIINNLSASNVVQYEVLEILDEYGNAANPTQHFTTTTCSGGPGPTICPGCNSGNHTWGNFNTWKVNFENSYTNASWFNAPNQPCQFLQNRITYWEGIKNGLSNCNAYYNQLECKIKHTTVTLLPQHNC